MGKSFLVSSFPVGSINPAFVTVFALGNAGASPIDTQAQRQIKFRQAGELSDLFINVATNSTTAASTLRVRKNGANGNLTLSIAAGATGIFEDTTHTDSVAVNDLLNYQLTIGTGGTGLQAALMGCTFTPTTSGISYTPLISLNPSNLTLTTASVTRHETLSGELVFAATTETQLQHESRITGTLKALSVYINTNARTTATTFKSRKNAADGNLSVSIGSTVTGLVEDLTNSDTVAVNDKINTAMTTGTGTQAISPGFIKIDFETATDDALMTSQYNAGIANAAGATSYCWIGGDLRANSTEPTYKAKIRDTFTFANLGIVAPTNTLNSTCTIRFRKNAANGNQVVSVTAGTTGWLEDTTNTDTVAAGDEINYSVVSAAGTGTINIRSISMTSLYASSLQNLTRTISDSVAITHSTGMLRNIIHLGSDSVALTHTTNDLRGLVQTSSSDSISVTEGGGGFSRLRGFIQVSSDSITVTDTRSKLTTKIRTLNQSLAFSEAISRLRNLGQLSSDSMIFTDTRTRLTNRIRTISGDSISFAEGISKLRLLLQSVSHSLAIVDSVLKAVPQRIRLLSHSLAFVEAISRLRGLNQVSSDSISLTGNAPVQVKEKIRTIAESIALVETISRMKFIFRTISNSIGLSESVSRLRGKVRTRIDSIALSHSLPSWFTTRIRNITHNISLVDISVRARFRPVSISNSIAFTDASERLRNKIKTLSNSMTFSDAVLGLNGFTRLVSSTINFADSELKSRGKIRTLTGDSIAFASTVSKLRGLWKTLVSQNLQWIETIQKMSTRIRIFTNSLTFNHLFTNGSAKVKEMYEYLDFVHSNNKFANKFRTTSDSLNLADILVKSRTKLRGISHSLNLTDNLIRQTTRIRTFSQNLNLADLVEKGGANLVKFITESINFSDSNLKLRNKIRTASDSLVLSHLLTQIRTKLRTLSQSLSLQVQDLSRQTSRLRAFTNNLNLTDYLERGGANVVKLISAFMNFDHNNLKSTTRLRNISHALVLTESMSRFKNRLRSVDYALTFIDLTTKLKLRIGLTQHNLSFTDTRTWNINRFRTLTDFLNFSSNHVKSTTRLRTILHSITLSDTSAQGALSSLLRTISENLQMSEGAQRAKGKIKSVTDSLALSSTVFRSRPIIIKLINDNLILSHQTDRLRLLVFRNINHNLSISSNVFRTVKTAIKKYRIKIRRIKKFRYP